MNWETFAPKKFFCYYPLSKGTLFIAIVMSCLAMLTGTSIIIQVITVQGIQCDKFVLRTAYGFGISALTYNLLMVLVNLWLIWAVKKKKTTVVIIWVVVTSVWLVKLLVLVIVLMIVHDMEVGKTGGTLCMIIQCLCFAVLIYFIFVVYGYWMEISKQKRVRIVADAAKESTKDVAKEINKELPKDVAKDKL
ncbi:PREDICTED: uncharacterized protein LOC106101535 [Papilio polytes]|uniref:uncharacterized protein LOC106101535 n=1 Tax=Papilio polytes TaxID=76194 RepID=UPI000676586B|nr:PREDICTED: uncharacterized protein LOC106101535 [Papilio polytes]